MSDQATKQRKTIKKTIGSGITSIVGNKSTFYVLEHKTPTKSHQAGSTEEIIVNYVELGRGRDCGVRFGDDTPTVSRRHAAIVREKDQYVLVNLSKTSPTVLNGKRVNNRWFLQNGDQIQLSMEGPKMGFIVPSNNLTRSMSIGRRMASFQKQALRPYKTALSILAALLLLVSLGGGYLLYDSKKENTQLLADLERNIEEINTLQSTDSLTRERADSLQAANEELASSNDDARRRNASLTRQLQRVASEAPAARPNRPAPVTANQTSAPGELRSLYPNIFVLEAKDIILTKDDGERVALETSWFGTGFLTKDGRFITARHVVQPWFYITDSESGRELFLANVLINNYGANISGKLVARSPNGEILTFNIDDFVINNSRDQSQEVTLEGNEHVIRHANNSPYDIAYANIRSDGAGLQTDPALSANLRAQQQLDILGYPLGFGSRPSNMSPIYSQEVVARDGLEDQAILTTSRGTDHGNSGGPVFVNKNDRYYVIGVVSGGYGQSIGRIVPLSLIY